MNQPPLRRTFLLSILTAITIGFAVFAIYVDRIEHMNRIEDIDAELIRAEQGNVGTNPEGEGGGDGLGPPGGQPANQEGNELQAQDAPIQLFIDTEGTLLSAGASGNPFTEATLVRLSSINGFISLEEGNFRARVTQLDRGQVSVTALPLDLADQARVDSRRALAVGAAVILLLVAAVTWILVGQLTRPITRLTAAATQIADGDLETDLVVNARSREVTELARDLDRMLEQNRATIEVSEQSAAAATQARNDMSRFLADISHELRTPLTALKGYSDLYAGGMLEETEDVDRAMSRIGSESERLYKLVDQMLGLARTSNMVSATEPVDVTAIANVVGSDLQAAHPSVEVEVNLDPTRPVISGVPSQIHQAVLNLGANACNYSSPGDTVRIEVTSDEASVEVQVVDYGPGVSDADKDRIFLPFFRADESRVRSQSADDGGAGLGLALTKQVVTHHHGTIEASDTPGGGATFTVTFPRRP